MCERKRTLIERSVNVRICDVTYRNQRCEYRCIASPHIIKIQNAQSQLEMVRTELSKLLSDDNESRMVKDYKEKIQCIQNE